MNPTALIIDDSRATRLMLGRALRALGFEILEADSAEAGLAVLDATAHLDIVLVDRNMPGVGGLGFVRGARARAQHRDLCLMMVSSETAPERVMEAFEAGLDEYLMKPVTTEALQSKLQLLGFSWGDAP